MSNADQSPLAVCDLCLNNEIHETVNLGFLYGLSLINPKQDIFFYADKGHQEVIKTNIKNKGLNLEKINYIHIPSNLNASYWGYVINYIIINNILDKITQKNIKRILVLSSVDFQRLVFKYLLKRKRYQHISCSFVMHGDLDCLISTKHNYQEVQEVAGTYFEPQEVTGTYSAGTYSGIYFHSKFIHYLKTWTKHTLGKSKNYLTPTLDFKAHLLSNHSPQIRYIVLAPHILTKLSNYVDTDDLGFHYVPHPAVFKSSPFPTQHLTAYQSTSKKLKCAIFGYGNPPALFALNQMLIQLWAEQTHQAKDLHLSDLANHLEIRIIGSNHQGTEAFSWVNTPIRKRALNRLEMEELVKDIDLLLILYESHRYQLSCSGSIIEALSYQKPVFFLDNPCIQAFNPIDQPIGQSFGSLQSLALSLINYICHPKERTVELERYRKNILSYRPQIDIKSNLNNLSVALGLKDLL